MYKMRNDSNNKLNILQYCTNKITSLHEILLSLAISLKHSDILKYITLF